MRTEPTFGERLMVALVMGYFWLLMIGQFPRIIRWFVRGWLGRE